MDRNNPFFRQVELLVRVLPHVAAEKCFALKGGTAINLFVRDLPRLSVDIDLVYLPLEPREQALPAIKEALQRIGRAIKGAMPEALVQATNPTQTDSQNLSITHAGSQIMIELSPVLRGTVWPVALKEVCPPVEETFGYAEMQVVALNDLYAGKICAALDRQHPRDLFDVKLLMENEGVSRDLFNTFLVYLISHRRPMAELLTARRKDIAEAFEKEFKDMTSEPVTLAALLEAREQMIGHIRRAMTDRDRKFLLSVKNKAPDWSLIDLPNVAELPAVKWKLLNLGRMSADKHRLAVDRLEKVLADMTET